MKSKKAPKKNMRKTGKTAGKTISTPVRKKSATIVKHMAGPKGGETKYMFPMPDKAHARNALARLNQAKGLSAAQKAKVRSRAKRMLGEK